MDQEGNDDDDRSSDVMRYCCRGCRGSKVPAEAADPIPISDCPEFYRLCDDLKRRKGKHTNSKLEITSVSLLVSGRSTADLVARLDQATCSWANPSIARTAAHTSTATSTDPSTVTDITIVLGDSLEPPAALALGKWIASQPNLQRLTAQREDHNSSSMYYYDNNNFCALDLFWDSVARNSSWQELTIVGERPSLGAGVARILNSMASSSMPLSDRSSTRLGHHIRKLTLRNCTLQDFDSVALVRLLNHRIGHGRPDESSTGTCMDKTCSLEQLHLLNCFVNAADTIRVVKAMTQNTTVTSFALLLTRMSPLDDPACASALAEFIQQNSVVTVLALTAVGNNHHHHNHNHLSLLQALATAMEDNVTITSFCLTAFTSSVTALATRSTPRRLDSMDRHVPAWHYRTHHHARPPNRRNHNFDNPHYIHARPSRRRLIAENPHDGEQNDETRNDDAIHPSSTTAKQNTNDENIADFYHSKIQHYVALNRAGRKYLKEDVTDRPKHESLEDCWFRMVLEHRHEHALVFSLLRDYPTILVEATVSGNK